MPESARVELDVREDIREGREPFARIMAAVDELPRNAALVLRAPFEPVPLYRVLGRRGFAHWTESRAPDDWSVWFFREAAPTEPMPAPAVSAAPRAASAGDGVPTPLDVRGLEPPHPMIRVLDAVEALAPGQRLEVWHDRRPLFLYPQLEERGCSHATDEPKPGLVRILIWRADPKE
jgi:uncharacterized protein (DUF2249 family)